MLLYVRFLEISEGFNRDLIVAIFFKLLTIGFHHELQLENFGLYPKRECDLIYDILITLYFNCPNYNKQKPFGINLTN